MKIILNHNFLYSYFFTASLDTLFRHHIYCVSSKRDLLIEVVPVYMPGGRH